jgi:N6-L-threonylcarbamoyladenine synthase
MKYILGIDTSCDETSMAVLDENKKVISNVISSQVKVHAKYGGVIPELASRKHIEALNSVFLETLEKASIKPSQLTGIAVTNTPGLVGCLLVGLSFAKSLAYSLEIPFTTVHHLKGHLFSPFIEHTLSYPFIGLVVSGGHTAYYYVESFDEIKLIGQTVDDAAGEAYDKVAKLLNLGYPGGPIIDKLAREGNSDRFKFTRAKVKKGEQYLSFSGLKTAVSKIAGENDTNDESFQKDLAASFQKEVVETLIDKTNYALKKYPAKTISLSGGVACNSYLRLRLDELAKEKGLNLYYPSPILCTDNGAMIGYVGSFQLEKNRFSSLEENAFASSKIS